jgi:hypothetical protein
VDTLIDQRLEFVDGHIGYTFYSHITLRVCLLSIIPHQSFRSRGEFCGWFLDTVRLLQLRRRQELFYLQELIDFSGAFYVVGGVSVSPIFVSVERSKCKVTSPKLKGIGTFEYPRNGTNGDNGEEKQSRVPNSEC